MFLNIVHVLSLQEENTEIWTYYNQCNVKGPTYHYYSCLELFVTFNSIRNVIYWHRMRDGFCSEIRIISQFKGQILCSYYIALVTPGSLVGFRARTYFNNKFCVDLEIMYSHRACIVIRSKTPICLRLIRFSQVHLIVTCNWKWTDWLVPDHR